MNKAGCCCLCGEEIYEVKRVFPRGHAREGEPMRIGRPLAGAKKCTMVQVSGRQLSVTLCKECAAELQLRPELYKTVHKSVLRAFERELEEIRRTDKQMVRIRKEITRIVNDPPIGILAMEDIGNG